MEYIESSWSAAASQVPEDVLLLNVETTGLRPSSSFVCMISAGYRKGEADRIAFQEMNIKTDKGKRH